MTHPQRIGFDLGQIAKAFRLTVGQNCEPLAEWMNSTYELSTFQQQLFESVFEEAQEDVGYWNEEELKIKFISFLFKIADTAQKGKTKVFYERGISANVNGYDLAVIVDCLVATSLPFNTPDVPYFFLQEFKKKRGEKRDPEAQMLTAMLIAQELNQDNKPVFGGYLFGSVWNFSTLHGTDYCVSREFHASQRADMLQIVFILRRLKELIMAR
jgi:hypothetical protein